MKKYAVICLLMLGILSGCGQKKAAALKLEDITQKSENCYSCIFDDVKHSFIIDMPDNADNAPLVIMLHGYGSSADDFHSSIQFEKAANPMGYAVVYVTGAPDPNDATSSTGWNSTSDPNGNKDTEFLVSLAKYLQEEYSLNKAKTYAVGFSNGAFMTHTLAMDASDTFPALVSVSGMMQADIWDKRKSYGNVSFFQITGEKDDVVPKNSDGSAKYTKAPPIEDVMAYWVKTNGADLTEKINIGKSSFLTKYANTDTHVQIWDLLVKDGGHSWYSEKINGFDTNDVILDFFESLD